MIRIENVSFNYNEKKTLNSVNLHIKKGECILLCGESGCGKTTVTKLINGLIPHFEEGGHKDGKVFVCGLDVSETSMYKLAEFVGSVFQNPKSQFFHTDAESEIVFGLENSGTAPEEIKKRFKKTVEVLDIGDLIGKNIFAMSGGEKQTLAFASVYAMNPEVFVLDEPTANLDMSAICRLRQQIGQIKKEGHTVIVAEHRLYFLTDLIDRAVYIKNGEISRIFTGSEMQALTEKERIKMGLRSLKEPELTRPEAAHGKESPAKTRPEEKGLLIRDLTCILGKTVIFEKLSFTAADGEITGIIGKNGAGKTTLTRCLCGLVKEKSGTISLDGRNLKLKDRNKESFCVMQDVNHQLFSDSVLNECMLSLPGGPVSEIEAVLRAFDLLDYKDCHPMALSGGQKQRLAVATAVLSGKRVLVFDEPTSGLDYRHMCKVSEMIKKLSGKGKIILIISHDFEFLEITCDTIFNMDSSEKTERRNGREAVR